MRWLANAKATSALGSAPTQDMHSAVHDSAESAVWPSAINAPVGVGKGRVLLVAVLDVDDEGSLAAHGLHEPLLVQ